MTVTTRTDDRRLPWDTTGLPAIEDVRGLAATEGPKAVHERWCHGRGSFEVMDGTYDQRYMCPHCRAAKEAAKVEEQVRECGIGSRYWGTTWEDLEMVEPLPALRAAAARITDIIRAGHSLILCGSPGTGKTQAAVLLARAAIEAGHTAAVANIGRIGMEIRAGYDAPGGTTESGETRRLSDVDLLVLDDLGAGEAGDAKIERRLLYFIAEARQNARRVTIATSNLTATELVDFVGERVFNRFMPAEVMPFNHGRNFRRPTARTLWAEGGPS
jgi:DNA replication protein DnaC